MRRDGWREPAQPLGRDDVGALVVQAEAVADAVRLPAVAAYERHQLDLVALGMAAQILLLALPPRGGLGPTAALEVRVHARVEPFVLARCNDLAAHRARRGADGLLLGRGAPVVGVLAVLRAKRAATAVTFERQKVWSCQDTVVEKKQAS